MSKCKKNKKDRKTLTEQKVAGHCWVRISLVHMCLKYTRIRQFLRWVCFVGIYLELPYVFNEKHTRCVFHLYYIYIFVLYLRRWNHKGRGQRCCQEERKRSVGPHVWQNKIKHLSINSRLYPEFCTEHQIPPVMNVKSPTEHHRRGTDTIIVIIIYMCDYYKAI